MSRPHGSKHRRRQRGPIIRTNGKIRAREVRVIGIDGSQVGVLSTPDAIQLARRHGVDLVEVAPNANPPVCRVVDFGKYRYEQSKKEKEAKKQQVGNKVKEIQLRPSIDKNDFSIKLAHAIDFLCEDMKVKVSLRFRGRELAHKEYGFKTIQRFVEQCTPFANADSPPKMIGRGINVMISPLPKNKRAANPRGQIDIEATEKAHAENEAKDEESEQPETVNPKAGKEAPGKPEAKNPSDKSDPPPAAN